MAEFGTSESLEQMALTHEQKEELNKFYAATSGGKPAFQFYSSKGGRPKIVDEFTDLPVSSATKWRYRMRKAGLCVVCGGKRPCTRHNAKAKAYRKRRRAEFEAWVAAGRPSKKQPTVVFPGGWEKRI